MLLVYCRKRRVNVAFAGMAKTIPLRKGLELTSGRFTERPANVSMGGAEYPQRLLHRKYPEPLRHSHFVPTTDSCTAKTFISKTTFRSRSERRELGYGRRYCGVLSFAMIQCA
jgi:hypothetical protein